MDRGRHRSVTYQQKREGDVAARKRKRRVMVAGKEKKGKGRGRGGYQRREGVGRG